MAAIVYQTNKKTGVTYAYESISYWDKDNGVQWKINRINDEDPCQSRGRPAAFMGPPTSSIVSGRMPE